MARSYIVKEEPIEEDDQTVRACGHCGGPLKWRYRVGVVWDRGLPVCDTCGLVRGWYVLNRTGDVALAIGFVDGEGVILPGNGLELPIPPLPLPAVLHHYKKRGHGQIPLLDIESTAVRQIQPQTWMI